MGSVEMVQQPTCVFIKKNRPKNPNFSKKRLVDKLQTEKDKKKKTKGQTGDKKLSDEIIV